jgi:hypothetical protein
MAVRHYLLETPAPPRLVAELREATGSPGRELGAALLFERAEGVPRAYAVRRVRYEPDLDTALRRLEAPGFRPREEAVVTGPPPPGAPSAGAAPEPGAGGPPDPVSILAYEAERVVVAAECAARCLLVLPDLYYPGWRASVGGREVPIERANAIFRGVWLEAGRHEVTFRFAPASFRAGLALFAATLLALAAGAARSARAALLRRRRLRDAPASIS